MKTCTRCRTARPDVEFGRKANGRLNSWCLPCYAQRAAEWYARNKTQAAARQRARYVRDPAPRKAAAKQRYIANREAELLYHKAHRQKHRERINQRRKRWRDRNGERERAKGRQWAQLRRARMLGVPHDLTAVEWQAKLLEFDSRCAYCGSADRKLTMDHVVALANGGHHTAANVVPACEPCNKRKGIQTAAAFMHRILVAN